MKQTPVKLGPLALLLTVISICLTVMAILTYVTAGADLRLAEKYADTVSRRYALETEGQELLRDLGQGSGEAVLERDGAVQTDRVENGQVTEWRHEVLWTENDDIGNLWIKD
jgi:hypothetical protein